jgi:CBS domain-containing protein
MATKVSSILKHKGHQVVSVAPHHTVASVVKVLTQNRIGAAPVIDEEGRLVGIISERDIIRGMSEHEQAALTLSAEQLMTREVRLCSPEDELVELMQRRRREAASRRGTIRSGAASKVHLFALAATQAAVSCASAEFASLTTA